MINANEVKTMEDATNFYNQEFEKIEKMDSTNEVKAGLLNQLNKTMTSIYSNLK